MLRGLVKLRIFSSALIMALLLPICAFAQVNRARDITLTVGRHDIRGSAVDFRHGTLIDGLLTGTLRPSMRSSPLVAGGLSVARGNMPECAVQLDGRCAPSGNFLAVNALHTLMRRGEATRVSGMLYLPPIVAVALEWPLFGVVPTLLSLIGIAVTCVGVALAVRK